MATTGYAAALDTNDVIMSYGPETVWGVNPAGTGKDIRLDSEGFSSTKSRTRPNEINPSGQASAAITTKVESTGSLNFSVSAGTHNDLLAASIGSVFSTPVAVSLTDVSSTATTLTSVAGVFTGLVPGQMVKISSSLIPAVNGVVRVVSLTGADKVLTFDYKSGTIGVSNAAALGTVSVKGSMVRNGTVFQSYTFQKTLSSILYMLYTGSFPTGGSLDVGVGDYLKGTLAFLNKSEVSAIADGFTGHTAPPNGIVVDSINGIGDIMRNAVAIAASIQKIGVKWNKEGAAAQFAIGFASAVGVRKGRMLVDGTLSSYFKDFSLYTEFINETGGPIGFPATDGLVENALTKGYYVTFTNATIMNPKITAGGAGQDVMADFSIEGNPDISVAQTYGGKTIQIDYFG